MSEWQDIMIDHFGADWALRGERITDCGTLCGTIQKQQKKITELTEQLDAVTKERDELKKYNALWAIEKLRKLQDRWRHQSKWNFSGEAKFAPVELSDYLLIQMRKEIKEVEGE